MTNDRSQNRTNLRLVGLTDATQTPHDAGPSVRWSTTTYTHHAGWTLDIAQPIMLDHDWPCTPVSCLTGFRVMPMQAADGIYVCPLCGIRTSP